MSVPAGAADDAAKEDAATMASLARLNSRQLRTMLRFLAAGAHIEQAMALLHARIARVIFGLPDAQHGALSAHAAAGGLQLHALRSLNHHFRVLQVAGIVEEWSEGALLN